MNLVLILPYIRKFFLLATLDIQRIENILLVIPNAYITHPVQVSLCEAFYKHELWLLHVSLGKPTMYQDTELIKQAIPLASSFNLCTETSNDSLSSSSLSKNAFLSIAWFSLCSKSSNETIVALETKSRILGSSAQTTWKSIQKHNKRKMLAGPTFKLVIWKLWKCFLERTNKLQSRRIRWKEHDSIWLSEMYQRAGKEPVQCTHLHFSQVMLQSHTFHQCISSGGAVLSRALDRQQPSKCRKQGTGILPKTQFVPWFQWDNSCVSKVSHEVKSLVETGPQLSDLFAR